MRPQTGEASFLSAGDRVGIGIVDKAGASIFGAIEQEVRGSGGGWAVIRSPHLRPVPHWDASDGTAHNPGHAWLVTVGR